ncbi:MAG TPA: peptidylprolyl isomerase [Myxococcales bacterium]|jgi:peptidyl-prolyl cis-trans isomerase SurA
MTTLTTKQKATTWAAALAAALLCAPVLVAAAPRMLDRVAAVVNEDMILYSEVYERAGTEMAALESEGQATPEKKKLALRHALDEVIADRLLVAEERNAGIEVGDQEVDMAVEDVRRQNGMDAATFERALASKGQTLAAFKDKMRKDLAAMKLIGQKVRAKIKISDEDLKGEYAKQSKVDEAEVEVHARHIVIQVAKDASKEAEAEALKRAEALVKRARAGEDFTELAKKYSEGPSKADGGDVGFFKRGEMVAAFDKVAFTLKPGEISDPVRSPFGWHVIQVLERRAGKVKSFDEVKDELRDRLWRDQMQRHTEQFVADLRKQATVEVRVPELKD